MKKLFFYLIAPLFIFSFSAHAEEKVNRGKFQIGIGLLGVALNAPAPHENKIGVNGNSIVPTALLQYNMNSWLSPYASISQPSSYEMKQFTGPMGTITESYGTISLSNYEAGAKFYLFDLSPINLGLGIGAQYTQITGEYSGFSTSGGGLTPTLSATSELSMSNLISLSFECKKTWVSVTTETTSGSIRAANDFGLSAHFDIHL